MPKVSVVIPNYNHAIFLEQRIETVLSQTFQDFEVILLDDASTDASRDILLEYAEHSKVKILFNEINSGSPFQQWSKGIDHAQGEYIWIAESDDYADPLFLETLVKILNRHPNVGIAYCQSCSIDQNNEVIAPTYSFWTDDVDSNRWKSDFINDGIVECRDFLACKNTIPNASAVLFRRNLYAEISKNNESFRVAGDWITWVEMLFLSDIYFVSEPLNYFRVHCNNTSRNIERLGLVVQESLRVIQAISTEVSISSKAKELSFNNVFQWWITYLWGNRFSWKSEFQTFLSILLTFQSLVLWKKAFVGFVQFLLLKLRNYLKLGTKLRNSFRFNNR